MRRYLLYLFALVALVALVNAPVRTTWGQGFPYYAKSGTCPTAVTVTTTGPTAVATSGGITTLGSQVMHLLASFIGSWGAGTSTVNIALRRGSGTSGTVVVSGTVAVAAAVTPTSYSIGGEDSPGEVAGQQYTLVVSPTGATQAGSVSSCELQVGAY